jgi:hypothetical protein
MGAFVMFVGIIYVTICTGWLCRMIHGSETEIVTSQRYTTIEECVADNELAAKWAIGDSYPWRVVCKKGPS